MSLFFLWPLAKTGRIHVQTAGPHVMNPGTPSPRSQSRESVLPAETLSLVVFHESRVFGGGQARGEGKLETNGYRLSD